MCLHFRCNVRKDDQFAIAFNEDDLLREECEVTAFERYELELIALAQVRQIDWTAFTDWLCGGGGRFFTILMNVVVLSAEKNSGECVVTIT